MVETDSSGYIDGGCLAQYNDQYRLHPVAYFSQKKLPAEVNYPIHNKEMLAIILYLKQWDTELRSTKAPFTVLTNHKNLQYFMQKQRLTERQMRWALELSKYHMLLKHRPGKQSPAPNALSRRDQDLPQGLDDNRLQGQVHQLLQPDRPDHTRITTAESLTETIERDDKDELEDKPRTDQYTQEVTQVQAHWIMGGDSDQDNDEIAPKHDPPDNPFENDDLRDL